MEEEKKKKKNGLSLRSRIFLIVLSCFIPLTALIGYLLYTQYTTVQAFDRVANSVNYASKYVKEFKERMDYSMYYATVWDKPVSELREGIYSVGGVELVYPYDYIEEMRAACTEMSDIATVNSNRYLPDRIVNTLNSLERIIEEIEENMDEGGHYDENEELLEDVRSLTDLVQENIQNYSNDENASFTAIKEDMMENTRKTLQSSILIVCVVGILTTIISNFTQRSVVQPVRKLCEASKLVAKGDFTVRSDVESKDEIAVLADNFNDMTVEIGRLVERIKEEQANIRNMESKLLQAQINPHFLYNTLDTIVWLAESGRDEEVVKMTSYLSEFFRTTLSKGKDYITLEEEKRHVESYLQIQQFRYQDIMDYRIEMDEEIMDYTVPKLTLQPLVENALYHGIKKKRGGGTILIEGKLEGNKILLKVIDNGKGMTEQELARLRRYIAGCEDGGKQGFGLGNVNQRIHRYYGEEYGIFFESEENRGTEAVIIIPAKIIEQKS